MAEPSLFDVSCVVHVHTTYAVLGQGLSTGSLTTILVAAASIVLGGLAATILVRQLRRPASP